MTKYKVGDVAALFSKPKEPTTVGGKKLQSLFQDFYGKKGKYDPQSNKNTIKENKETDSHRKSKKSKRKFSEVDNSELVCEKTSKKIKHMFNQEENGFNVNGIVKEKKVENKDFPRKKKKGHKRNSQNFNNNDFVKPEIKVNSKSKIKTQAVSENENKTNHNKKGFNFIKKSKQSLSFENNVKHKNVKSLDKVQEEDDTEIKGEIQQIIKDFSKKSEKVEKEDFQQNHQKKIFNKKEKNKNQNFESKVESNFFVNDLQNDIKESKAVSNKKEVPDFVRRPKKSLAKNEKNRKDKKKSKVSILADDNNNVFGSVDENSPFSNKKNQKSKSDKGTIIPNTFKNLSEQPDFIKLENSESENPSSKQNSEDALSRTLFIGNLPVNISKSAVKELFSRFGEIEHVKYHGVETDKAKIFSDKGPKSINPHYAADSVPGFVVFKEKQSAIDALSLRGSLFKGHHITVDFAKPAGTKKIYDNKRSIFIGNLPFLVDDESIWNAFSDCGQIEGVRVVRDRETGISKGFGYVLFSTVQAKENALALENVQIHDRTLRILPVKSGDKSTTGPKSSGTKNTFKSRAIRVKKSNKNPNSRKSIKKLMKREKTQHNKKKVASILQKAIK